MNFVDRGPSSLGSHIVTGVAIIGVLLGAAGLYAALSVRGASQDHEDRLLELERRVDRMSAAIDEINGQIRGLHHNTRSALQNLSEQINQMRQEMRVARSAPASVQTVNAAESSAAASASGAASPARTYTIRAGDLIAKIARENNTTVDAIIKANPGLNPNRIKVGQVINLP
jgi:TolA-binding protein